MNPPLRKSSERPRRTPGPLVLVTATLVLVLLGARVPAQEGGDVEAQILYAFHTEDANALQTLAASLTQAVNAQANDPAQRYHLAHAQYRRGLLLAAGSRHEAGQAFADCVDELKPLTSLEPPSVEALVLQSACYRELADYRALEAPVLRLRGSERLKRALALEPANPRALLIAAEIELSRAGAAVGERERAARQLEAAARQFDAASATQTDAPAWGHADAYLALGEELQRRGDTLGARNWLEKALLTAPDYKAAQRRLESLNKPRLTAR